jgi:hypothetical protein
MSPKSDTPFQDAHAELKSLGLVLRYAPGEYRVNFRNGRPETEFITDDLQEALARGREMASHPPPEPAPPVGPLGPRSRRGTMYRHNRKLAARRRRQSAENEA